MDHKTISSMPRDALRIMLDYTYINAYGIDDHPIFSFSVIDKGTGWSKEYCVDTNSAYKQCINELLDLDFPVHAWEVGNRYKEKMLALDL